MADLKHATYCGLYCRLRTHTARIPHQVRALQETMRKKGWEHFGKGVDANFAAFWQTLERLSTTDDTCPGCRGGCGLPGCEIRACAREREVEVCPMCEDYPCARIEDLGRAYPTLLWDGACLQRIGLDAWIAKQEERRATNFAYADIRCPGS
ncbi:MAG: DUF3795 domain-containing protein [Armatimonadota bacterium]